MEGCTRYEMCYVLGDFGFVLQKILDEVCGSDVNKAEDVLVTVFQGFTFDGFVYVHLPRDSRK